MAGSGTGEQEEPAAAVAGVVVLRRRRRRQAAVAAVAEGVGTGADAALPAPARETARVGRGGRAWERRTRCRRRRGWERRRWALGPHPAEGDAAATDLAQETTVAEGVGTGAAPPRGRGEEGVEAAV